MATIITIYSFLAVSLIVSFIKSKEKSKESIRVAGKAILKIAPSLLAVLVINIGHIDTRYNFQV